MTNRQGISWRERGGRFFSRDMGRRSGAAWVAGAVLFVTAMKFFVSRVVIGTNDTIYWMDFADVIRRAGSLRIYALLGYYNHPPLISWLLAGLNALEEATGWPFPFLVRLGPILADAGSVLVVWSLLQRRRHPHALALTLICCFNPVSFLVSAYHGNTDPVFIFFVLLAILFAESRWIFWAGFVLGLSFCVKIVPVIFVPVFFFWLREARERRIFCSALLICPLVVFLPALILIPGPFLHNVFQYSGLKGIWGFGHACLELLASAGLLRTDPGIADVFFRYFVPFALLLYFCLNVVGAWLLAGRRRVDLIEGAFLAVALFLVLTPGFGIQYLSWPVYFAVLSLPALGTAWVFLAGAFLLRVYAFWGGFVPPYYADSYLAGQWTGWDRVFDLVLWALLLVLMRAFFGKKRTAEKK